jgi:hypothetical protein
LLVALCGPYVVNEQYFWIQLLESIFENEKNRLGWPSQIIIYVESIDITYLNSMQNLLLEVDVQTMSLGCSPSLKIDMDAMLCVVECETKKLAFNLPLLE